jgi:photosystem II stability/assembly factor-like uncharacterized protein
VYRSLDGGSTWQHVGLESTEHIARVRIHPNDPNTVYVAALGRLWGPNRERGIYKTTDGGKTWRQIKFIDDRTGFIDLALDPKNPDIIYACAYSVRRDEFATGNPAVQTSKTSGIYRSLDAGKNWTRLAGGLPDRPLGRCGIDIYRQDPHLLYAIVPTDRTGSGVAGQPAAPGGPVSTGGVFRSADGGQTWIKVNSLCPRPFYFGQIRIDPSDERTIYVLGVSLQVSHDGGQNFHPLSEPPRLHPDHHALWIDPHDSDHLLIGNDGGLSGSQDRGATWDHFENLPIGQFYGVALDSRQPYRIFGGMQDSGSWYGPVATLAEEGTSNRDWRRLAGADGFRCSVDPDDSDRVFLEAQYGRLNRVDLHSGAITDIRPRSSPWGAPYRFNWDAPLLLSPHDPNTVYFGGNVLFRSTDNGDHWKRISLDLTRGPRGSDLTAHTLTAIAESPAKAGLLYAGSDDGRLHVSRDSGGRWHDISGLVPALDARGSVTTIECSPFDEDTAFVSIDRHALDDRRPYLYRTRDHGESWEALHAGLPQDGPVLVVRADSRNPHLLFCGTQFGLFVSLSDGEHWQHLRDLPTVAVMDLAIHPREREMVVATHGRALYVVDISVLEQFSEDLAGHPAYLFDIKPVTLAHRRPILGWPGDRTLLMPNPPAAAAIYYYLAKDTSDPVQLVINSPAGEELARIKGDRVAGLHRINWKLGESESNPSRLPAAGDYVVKLQVGKRTSTRKLRLEHLN